MESPDDRLLSDVVEAIADGRPVAWADLLRRTKSSSGADLVRQLQVLEAIASLHRPQERVTEAANVAMTPAPAPIGAWGGYELLEEIGQGSFGVVYRARDVRLDRNVALKLLTHGTGPHVTGGSAVAEGRLLARLRHPNVITVYGADVIDGVVGISMELLAGRTLEQELVDRGPVSAREAALVGVDLCHALAAVHRAGFVHRDVKPHNVMREAGGRIVLMDFGAGRDTGHTPRDVSTAGTPLYMAPEVLDGAEATAASDLYSLGIVLFKLVTGELPVTADSLDELRKVHASGQRRRLRDVRPDLPSAFIRAVEGATARDPAARTHTAADLEQALESVLSDSSTPGLVPRLASRARRAFFIKMATVTAAFAATIVLWNGGAIRDRIWPPQPTAIRSLAVLPFANLTGQDTQDYLVDGVTQLLSNNLAQLPALRVISTTSSMTYKGTTKALATIARELRIDGVVEGSFSRSGDRLRITVSLVRANDEHVWGQTYERPAADLFKVQGEIATMIAEAIKLSLTEDQWRNLATQSVREKAQDAFLRGLQRMNDVSPDTLRRALVDLQEAVNLDPGSARAWATLSQCYLLLGSRDIITDDEAYSQANMAATRALLLDDSVSEAHTELAEVKFYYEWNWESAQREYERALELNQNNSHAMARYALFLSALGRHREAFEAATSAARLDPYTPTVRFVPGMALFYARRYDEAISAFLGLANQPPYALSAADHYALGRSYLAAGNSREAFEEIGIALKQGGRLAPWLAELARVHVYDGNTVEARKILQELAGKTVASSANLAFVYAALGDKDSAFVELNRAADDRSPSLLWANVDPRLDELRTDPRFRELIGRIGLSK